MILNENKDPRLHSAIKIEEQTHKSITQLTRALVSRDDAAFIELHRLYFDRLYRYALVVSRGNEEDAADAVQQTMTKVVRYARVFESEEAFWSWLTVLLRSAARDAGRKSQRRFALLEQLQNWLHPAEILPKTSPALKEYLYEALTTLSADDRHLLDLKYNENQRTRAIAETVSLTEKAVESRLARLRKTLREVILKRIAKHEP